MWRYLYQMLILACIPAVATAEKPLFAGATFAARDTLAPGSEASSDAQACLDGLVWQPADFEVRVENPLQRRGDWKVQFRSPIDSGDAVNDTVSMEWYVARDEANAPITAPAVVVVHESGSGMNVGRLIAQGLRTQGLHALMIHLPYYGERRPEGKKPGGENLVPLIRQAVADVRRARDAVATLPFVDPENVSLQGTSLGGFIVATTAGLDNGYQHTFIMLAGGGLMDVIQNGDREAAQFRDELERAGLTGDKLKRAVATVEPLRIAHRLDPATTWLYSAQFDKVVPPANSYLLAQAAMLDPSHHYQMLANHYTGIIYVPYLIMQMREHILPTTPADELPTPESE